VKAGKINPVLDLNLVDMMDKIKEMIKKWHVKKSYSFDQDCAHFVADVYKSVTGKDVFSKFTGKYNSKEEADQWLADNGYSSIEDCVTDLTGVQPIDGKEAKYGDLVSVTYNGDYCVGVCYGARAYFVGMKKMHKVPLRFCNLAWRIS